MPSLAYKCTDKGYISFGNINEFGSFHGDILTLIYSNEEYKGDICIDNVEKHHISPENLIPKTL